MKNYVDKKNIAFLVGGVLLSALGSSLKKSGSVRRLAVASIAQGMKVQKEILSCYEGIKEEASDIFAEAEQHAKDKALDEIFE